MWFLKEINEKFLKNWSGKISYLRDVIYYIKGFFVCFLLLVEEMVGDRSRVCVCVFLKLRFVFFDDCFLFKMDSFGGGDMDDVLSENDSVGICI